jgi:hypothetical protein
VRLDGARQEGIDTENPDETDRARGLEKTPVPHDSGHLLAPPPCWTPQAASAARLQDIDNLNNHPQLHKKNQSKS